VAGSSVYSEFVTLLFPRRRRMLCDR